MEYKICENCKEKLHVRTQKCPFCNTVLTEKSEIVTEEEPVVVAATEQNVQAANIIDETAYIENDIEHTNLPGKEVKDYIYKAEVRHTLEYTKLLPNGVKVFLTAISMLPVFGQVLGAFFGVFFLTYDDSDRRSFGISLIALSVIMFAIYFWYMTAVTEMIASGEFSDMLNQIQ